jgi:RNA polymerase sigma-70 factor (ECF subfamily)
MDFTDTRWSIVAAASQNASPNAGAALETLCKTYWFPIYVYVRRRGY